VTATGPRLLGPARRPGPWVRLYGRSQGGAETGGPGGLDRGQPQERLGDRLRYRRDRPRGRSILTV